MRIAHLVGAAMLIASPVLAQNTTTTPSTTPSTPHGQAAQQNLSALDRECQQGHQQACQDAARMRSGSNTTMPSTSGSTTTHERTTTTTTPSR